MKLDKFNRLKLKFEIFKFEKNYHILDRVLYYFSFLGNALVILFSYFFIKNVTDFIPQIVPWQDVFFSIFIILFMTGYELFKRFALEQLTVSFIQNKSISIANILGTIVCVGLIVGSFYLSLNGAHRLVDRSDDISYSVDSTIIRETDSINVHFNDRILVYQNQIDNIINASSNTGTINWRQEQVLKMYDSKIAELKDERDKRVKLVEDKYESKKIKLEDKNKENDIAFIFITIFLELIVLIGVSFDGYYSINSYNETKALLNSPKYKQLELNLQLLKLYYQNGRKKEGDNTIPVTKLRSLVSAQKLDCRFKDVTDFVNLCGELEITKKSIGNKKIYSIPYEGAKSLLENQEMM